MRLSRAAVLAVLLLAAPSARALKTESLVSAPAVAGGTPTSTLVTSGQALVRLDANADTGVFDAALAALGAKREADYFGGWRLVTWNGAMSVPQALTQLAALPGVLSVVPSRVYKADRVPNDPSVVSQYALGKVDAFRAWEFEVGNSSRVTIGIVDSGISGSNAELSGKLSNTVSRAFNPNNGAMTTNNPPTPACNHATRVAGVAAASAENAEQIAGMSWGAQLVSLKVFLDADCPSADCSGACLTNDPGIISAIAFATTVANTAAYGRMVLNLSLGGDNTCDAALQSAIDTAVGAPYNIVFVVSTGNDGGAVNAPGKCNNVIPVGATNSIDQVASFSSRGAELSNFGVVAPGVSVLTTDVGGGSANATGTSFAAPMTAGLAALLLSARPTLTPAQVQTHIRNGAESLGLAPTIQGAGRINAYRSLGLAINGTIPGPALGGQAKPFAFPNPLRLSQTAGVVFSIPTALQGVNTIVKVYTLDGQLVRQVSGVVWNGRNTEGNMVASGTYVFVVSSELGTARGRVAVIR